MDASGIGPAKYRRKGTTTRRYRAGEAVRRGNMRFYHNLISWDLKAPLHPNPAELNAACLIMEVPNHPKLNSLGRRRKEIPGNPQNPMVIARNEREFF